MKNDFTGLMWNVEDLPFQYQRNVVLFKNSIKEKLLTDATKQMNVYLDQLLSDMTAIDQPAAPVTGNDGMAEAPQKEQVVSWILSLCNAAAVFELDCNDAAHQLDLYIVLSSQEESSFKELEPLIKTATLGRWKVLFSLCQLALFNEKRKQGSLFHNVYCNEQTLLYRAEGAPLDLADHTSILLLETAAEAFKKSRNKGLRLFEIAVQFEKEKENAFACFALHQAIEITLRGFVAAFSGVHPRQHCIKQLLLLCNRIHKGFVSFFQSASEIEALACLQESYTAARYNNDFTVADATVQLLKRKAANILALADRICREQIGQYRMFAQTRER
ncbi:hypothetical protein A8C56_17470 [Niabella ginsenosidivorans]|uniref:HEPN domain-containing protein n=1 Tax=Niabella ginsenosidivorans TaxID=1176587 RepID=A0A1A9I7L6_9BACT|nr:HEPN domain-containing protein [Niabella ginsenosidivorans]ANH82524.1 hypothetical protein A8C56_17470 [Niabella ginsenosidivorans]